MISKRELIVHRLSFVLVLFAFFIFAGRSGAADQSAPAGVIKTFNAALLEAMKKAGALGYSGRYRLLEPVIRETFALSFMADQSSGRYWKTLSGADRESVIKAYTDWTVATYAGRFDGYSGEKFEIASENATRRDTVTVVSDLIKPNGEEVKFHYLLRKTGGAWRVIDIQISGVSQLALTRAQFTGVIRAKGIKGLLSMLDEKIKGFERGDRKD
jgi:phospholipid transport system substrate-binding protein